MVVWYGVSVALRRGTAYNTGLPAAFLAALVTSPNLRAVTPFAEKAQMARQHFRFGNPETLCEMPAKSKGKDMSQFPRTRAETSATLTPEEISGLLLEYWGFQALKVDHANSRCVFFVDLPQDRLIFRSNPGWDGPISPPVVIAYIDHLFKSQVAAPRIVPTLTGELCVPFRDYTISVETLLPGKKTTSTQPAILLAVGRGLAQIHNASALFTSFPHQMRPAREYVEQVFSQPLTYPLTSEELKIVTRLFDRVQKEYETILDLPIPWLLCRGDVRAANTLVTAENEVWFTDFSSAHYAPALWDLVMLRFQWLLGEGGDSRFLEASEVINILLGYHNERPLSATELSVFPVLWAAYYADRLTFLHTKWEPDSPNRSIWHVEERISRLPTEAIEMGQELIGFSGLL